MSFHQIKTIEELLQMDAPGLACDLDETCSYTVFRWMELLLEEFGSPENLTAQQMVEKYQYVQNVPYFYVPEIDARIKELATSNQLQTELPLIAGADIFLQKVDSVIPIRCYLTTRPETVVDGTVMWLEKHKFPKAAIFAKPQDVAWADGSRWKAEILRKSFPQILGIIDDNQWLLKELGSEYPGKVFLFGHNSLPNGCQNVVLCPDWKAVYLEVRAAYLS